MEMPAQAAPALSPPRPAPVKSRKPWVRNLLLVFKTLYIFVAGFFSVWIASFAPVGSPSLTTFVPARAGVVFHVRDGSKLLKNIVNSSAAAELRDDPDLNEVNGLKDKLDNWKNAPRLARWLLPYRVDTFFPIAGKEILYAVVIPVSNPGAEAASAAADGKKKRAHQSEERLLMTQLSGGRGHLLRIIAQFWKPKDAEFYDLGGGTVALGYSGGKPVFNPSASKAKEGETAPEGSGEIVRIEIYPPIIQGKPIEPDEVKDSPIGPRLADLAESTVRALLRPPGPVEILNTHETPKEISLSFYSSPDGVVARGQIIGGVPALPEFYFDPAREMPTAQDKDNLKPYAEGLLPIDGKAAFFSYVTQQLAVKPSEDPAHQNTTRRLSGKQQRLLDKLAAMEDDVDLDRDIWPMGGHSVRFRVDDLPPEYNQIGYGLLRMAVPLDARKPETRLAAKHLVGIGWTVYDREKPAPKDARQPYVQEITSGELDRYIVVNGQGWAPTIAISNHSMSVVSDAGPYALLETDAAHSVEAHQEKAQNYFIRLDGRRLAASAETFARSWYESEEKDIGSQKFLKDHPHSAAWINLDRKLTGLLGDFSISLTPSGKGNGTIDLIWKPGTTKVEGAKLPQSGGTTNSVPAPPPGDDAPAPAPPPPD
jgi:hypothetical protein